MSDNTPKEKFEFRFKKYVTIDKNDQEKYNNLKKTPDSFLYNQEFTKIFIWAMTLGYIKGESKKIQNPLRQNIPTDVFTPEERWMMISIYMSKKNKTIDALFEADEILSNAEKYANGGFPFLWDMYKKNSNNPIEEIEEEFRLYL